jgi:hypothetical protein
VLAADLAFLQSSTLEGWIEWLKNKAGEYQMKAQLQPQADFWPSLLAGLLEFFAGVLPALLGGYASHLVCDATTPFGIPLC